MLWTHKFIALLIYVYSSADIGLSEVTDYKANSGSANDTSMINRLSDSRKDKVMDFIDLYDSEKPDLEIDKAWFTINSTVNHDIEIWGQSDECYKCDLMLIERIPSESTWTILVNSSFHTKLKLVWVHPGGSPKQVLCSFHTKFRERGDYWVFINYQNDKEAKCNLILANDPPQAELPILYVALGLAVLAVLYGVGRRLYTYTRKASTHRQNSMDINTQADPEGSVNGKSSQDGDDSQGSAQSDAPKPRTRLRSLDTFRGLTLTLMIFVNYGAGHYWFFEHAPWNGINVADLVFPWFVFIMGVSMTFSFRSMFKKGWSIPRIVWKIVWRSAKLFALGFMWGTVHWVADLPNVRVFGVLQRLALTYLITSLIHLCFARKVDSHQEKGWAAIRDIVLYIPEWLANLILLAVHLGIIYGLPVEGCPTGYTGPGGMSESGRYWNCTGGATQYVDALILGENHMYQWPTPQILYQTSMPFDPEGILGTLGCIFLCFLGVQCGRIFLIYQDHKQRIIRFIVWAVILGSLGALLSKCTQDDGWIPPNKNIWSLSYTLITGCFAYVLITVLFVVVDVFNVWPGQPFTYPGMNSIMIYLCHGIFYKMFPISWLEEEVHWKLLLQCVWATATWVIVAYWLFVKKIFIAL